MITEEQLKEWEDVALSVCFLDLQKIMLELIAEVRRNNILEERLKALKQEFDQQIEHLVQTRRDRDHKDCTIKALYEQVNRLEEEADWLALYCSDHCGCDVKFCMRECPMKSKDFRTGEVWCSTPRTEITWREIAKQMVEKERGK